MEGSQGRLFGGGLAASGVLHSRRQSMSRTVTQRKKKAQPEIGLEIMMRE